jgi:hypothetical protein
MEMPGVDSDREWPGLVKRCSFEIFYFSYCFGKIPWYLHRNALSVQGKPPKRYSKKKRLGEKRKRTKEASSFLPDIHNWVTQPSSRS